MGNFIFLPLWQIILLAIVGPAVLIIIVKKPNFFWPILISVLVATSGLMLKGYCLVEEYLVGCILVGVFLAISAGTVKLKKDTTFSLHKLIFYLMIIYVMAQSFRGMVIWQDWRIIRWVIYYAMLGLLLYVISKAELHVPNPKQISLIASIGGLIYLCAYFLYGLYYELKLGADQRFVMQGVGWSGPAYALFPLAIILLSAVFLLKDDSGKRRWLGLITIGISVIVSFFYYARVGRFSIIIILIASLPILGFKKLAKVFICLLIIYPIFFYTNKYTIRSKQHFKEEIIYSVKDLEHVKFLWSVHSYDIDRNLQNKISFAAVNKNWNTLFFGYGIHSHHYVLVPYKKEFYAQYLPNEKVGDVVRTTAFAALLTDTGLVGIALLIMNFLLSAREVFLQLKSSDLKKYACFFLSIFLISFFWLFITNIQDIMLFYSLIMPSGLISQLSKQI